MNVWLFRGADGLSALTINAEGANLPEELGRGPRFKPSSCTRIRPTNRKL